CNAPVRCTATAQHTATARCPATTQHTIELNTVKPAKAGFATAARGLLVSKASFPVIYCLGTAEHLSIPDRVNLRRAQSFKKSENFVY
ncbi:MAG: hypothetical protein NZM94_15595, partial [Roseiflexus sp.]|nr:hypothetical protein [Roseiflexus sp.]